MQEETNDVHKTADVILMIIKYEGEIEDIIEYPSEFEDAYSELVRYKVIKSAEGKYVPDRNFEKAASKGFGKFVYDLQNPPRYKQFLANKPALGMIAGALVLTAGYLIQSENRKKVS